MKTYIEYTTTEMIEGAFNGAEFESVEFCNVTQSKCMIAKCIDDKICWSYNYETQFKPIVFDNNIWTAKWRKVNSMINWSTIPVDTKLICTNKHGDKIKAYFAKINGGQIATYASGLSSWNHNGYLDTGWRFVELAE